VGEIIFDDEIPCGDEIRLDGGWVDLISSEAKPKISSALADFILASARISFSVRVRIHTQKQQKYLFCIEADSKVGSPALTL